MVGLPKTVSCSSVPLETYWYYLDTLAFWRRFNNALSSFILHKLIVKSLSLLRNGFGIFVRLPYKKRHWTRRESKNELNIFFFIHSFICSFLPLLITFFSSTEHRTTFINKRSHQRLTCVCVSSCTFFFFLILSFAGLLTRVIKINTFGQTSRKSTAESTTCQLNLSKRRIQHFFNETFASTSHARNANFNFFCGWFSFFFFAQTRIKIFWALKCYFRWNNRKFLSFI